MSDSDRKYVTFAVRIAICILLQSCTSESTDSSSNDPAAEEYLYAHQCELSAADRPGSCAADAPYLVARVTVGGVNLRIPRLYLRKTAQGVMNVGRTSYGFCWPGLSIDLTSCPQSTGRIIFYMEPGPPSDTAPYRPQTERLAELTRNYGGPLKIEGTVVDEYRHRNDNGVAPVFSFQSEDGVRIARCQYAEWGRCVVRIREMYGLSIRYEFGINLVGDWPEIDEAVNSLTASFIAAPDSY